MSSCLCRCTQSDSLRRFNITTTVYDIQWDLFAFAGYSTAAELGGGAIVVAFRGTDSHSLYNWVENMRYWKTDYDIPYPGSEGALVHTGQYVIEAAPCCLMYSSLTATMPAVRLAKSSSSVLCVDSLLLLTTILSASPTCGIYLLHTHAFVKPQSKDQHCKASKLADLL